MTYELTTDRLRLRLFTEQDAPAVQALCNCRAIYNTTLYIPHPYTVEHALHWMTNHQRNLDEQRGYEWAITNKDTGELYGAIGLSHHQAHRQGELAYWVGERYWNKGIGTEAAQAVIQFAFTTKNMHKVYARYFAENVASGKIMEKIGMRYEGTQRQHILKDGQWKDLVLYGIINEEESK